MEKCFFSVVVRILMGCFGILVLFKYVLILVYCLYNGSYYVEGYKSLKVGFLLRNGIIEWWVVSFIKMFKMWKNGSDLSVMKYDYVFIKF